jgi:hypothetical protein
MKAPVEKVALASATRVNWSDGSLGHPEPGKAYIQLSTSGFRLVFDTPAGEREYHTDDTGHYVYCGIASMPDGREVPPVVEACRVDLAKRLKSDEKPSIVEFREVTWPSAALGFAHEGAADAPVGTPGYRVALAAQGALFEYHTATNELLYGGEMKYVAFGGDAAIAYLKPSAEKGLFNLWATRIDGEAVSLLVPRIASGFAISRQGNIVAAAAGPDHKFDIGLWTLDGKLKARLGRFCAFQQPVWNADGTRFAAWVRESETGSGMSLVIGDATAGTLALTGVRVPGRGQEAIFWSGDRVLYGADRWNDSATGVYDAAAKTNLDIVLPEVLAIGEKGLLVCLPGFNPPPPDAHEVGAGGVYPLEVREGENWTKRRWASQLRPAPGAAIAVIVLPGNSEAAMATGNNLTVTGFVDTSTSRWWQSASGEIIGISLNPTNAEQVLMTCRGQAGGTSGNTAAESADTGGADIHLMEVADIGSDGGPRIVGRCAGAATWFTVPGK